MSVQRIWETFVKRNLNKEHSEVEKRFILNILIFFHVTGLTVSFLEYFIIHREINLVVTSIGISMYMIALIGRNYAIKNLGIYHSINIEIRENHQLIKKGLYRYLRHPIYLFTIIELIGIPLIPNSYYSLCIPLFCYIPFLFIRIYYEEKAMIRKFGEEYTEYKKEVRRLIPTKGKE